jgi:hypothetical protein
MLDKSAADKVAVALALLVLFVGAVVVAENGPRFAAPTKTTTVNAQSTGAGPGKRTTTTERTSPGGRGAGKKVTRVTEQPNGNPSSTTTTTTEVESRSFIERVLGNGGLILLEAAIVLLAAFLAGAFAQRLLVGDFAVKLGFLELGTVQAKNEQTIKDITTQLGDLRKLRSEQAKALDGLKENVGDLSSGLGTIGTAINELRERVSRLEQGKTET